MKRAVAFFLYLVVWLGLAALLAPLAYTVLHDWIHAPFSRYVNRCLMISAIVLLGPLLHYVRFSSLRDWGVSWPESGASCLRMPFLAGLASVLGLIALAVGGGWMVWVPEHGMKVVAPAFLAAALVPLLEGLLFRGVFQSILLRAFGTVGGIIGIALLFAVVHFLKVPRDFVPEPVTWSDGFRAVILAFGPLTEMATEWPRFFSVWMVGLILGSVAWRDGHIWRSVALHAGWVLGLQLARDFVPTHVVLWGGMARLDGSVLTMGMLLIFAGYWFAVLDLHGRQKA
jgi:membrane protease YdiL (CAAX protease family)